MSTLYGFHVETPSVPKPPPLVPVREVEAPRAVSRQGSAREQQIRGLVQQLFFRAAPTPVRHVGFASVERPAGTPRLCLEIAQAVAEENRFDVGLIDAQVGEMSLQRELELECPTRADSAWPIGSHLWMVPRESWLPEVDGKQIGDQHLSRLREISTEFDFSILWCDAVSWITPSIGKTCDGLVLVLTADKTRRAVAAQIKDQFTKAHVAVLGTILAERRFPVPEGLYRRL